MSDSRPKVVVAMSGGVDSSVAAVLLAEQGYDVVGLFMRVGAKEPANGETCSLPRPSTDGRSSSAFAEPHRHQGCCSAADAADARSVAGRLGVPFYALNFADDFDRIIDYFADEYVRGRTPNPCVVCNDRLKFGRLVEYADAVGAQFIATGHYAKIVRRDDRPALARAADATKDQTYVLFGLRRTLLDRLLFPIGGLTKHEVREIAARHGLPNANKPDSVDICFVPDRNYSRVVRERRPDGFVPGDVLSGAGEVIGRHEGVAAYTIGQRRGVGVAAGRPVYVTAIDVASNTITLDDDHALLASGLVASRVNLLADVDSPGFRAEIKIRYLHAPALGNVRLTRDGAAEIRFDVPQRAVTPGQAVVFYDGDVLLGGGWIDRAIR